MFVTGGSEGRGATVPRKFTISRRRLLHGGVGLGSLLLLPRRIVAADAHDHAGMSATVGLVPDKAVRPMDQPLMEPEVRRSANGVLQTSINCHYTYKDVGGVRLYIPSYDWMVPGSTL